MAARRLSSFEIYRDKKREWRWKLKASNGRIVADCAEGYKRKSMLLKSLGGILTAVLNKRYQIVET